MIGIEELGSIYIGSDVLDDDVGGVAPASNGDIAIGLCEALKRSSIGAFHNLDARAGRKGKAARVHALNPCEVGLQRSRNSRLARCGTIFEAIAVGGARAFIDSERGCLCRLQSEEIFSDRAKERAGAS